jgi:hypothetical protein
MIEHLKSSLFVFLFLLALAGCQATTGHYLGAVADADNIIRMASAEGEERRWQDIFLTIDSGLQWQNQNPLLVGQVTYSLHPQMMYQRATQVTLRVFLLDGDNRVVSYQSLPGIFPGRTDETTRFSLPLHYAERPVAYTFGYEVTFIDDEGLGSRHWNLPRTGR